MYPFIKRGNLVKKQLCSLLMLVIFFGGKAYACDPFQNATITDIVLTEPTCFGGSNGQITVTATSIAQPITFELVGVEQITNNVGMATFTGLAAGMYMVRVTDKDNCEDARMVTLNQPDPIKFTQPLATPVTCKGLQNGTILLEPSQVMGGTPPYTYSIGTNAGFIPVGTPFVNLAAGMYAVKVRDSNGCESMPMSVMVLPAEKITICKVCTTPATDCENNGTLCVVAKSVTGLHYSLNGGPFQNSPEFINLAPGTYRVVVNRQGDNEGECATCCAKVKCEGKR
jgi:uncharacterized protein (DUF2141 family)